jgi:hypothetical protein
MIRRRLEPCQASGARERCGAGASSMALAMLGQRLGRV